MLLPLYFLHPIRISYILLPAVILGATAFEYYLPKLQALYSKNSKKKLLVGFFLLLLLFNLIFFSRAYFDAGAHATSWTALKVEKIAGGIPENSRVYTNIIVLREMLIFTKNIRARDLNEADYAITKKPLNNNWEIILKAEQLYVQKKQH
ncbi:MAG: hypothetical protein AB1467_00520 [Candidatus Diapherotrites archaeon]